MVALYLTRIAMSFSLTPASMSACTLSATSLNVCSSYASSLGSNSTSTVPHSSFSAGISCMTSSYAFCSCSALFSASSFNWRYSWRAAFSKNILLNVIIFLSERRLVFSGLMLISCAPNSFSMSFSSRQSPERQR